MMKSYAEVLRDYHLSPEHKFGNGDCYDFGETKRLTVNAVKADRIGKEANYVSTDKAAVPYAGNEVAVFNRLA